LTYSEAQLPKLQAAALQQLAEIRRMERESAARAVLAGLTLIRVKHSLKHGQFLPWLKQHVQGVGYQQCNFYMGLAQVFVAKARITKPDMLALPGDQTALSLDAEGEARGFFSKLEKFVGEASLNDLLDKHGLKKKKLGGKRTSAADTGDGDDTPTDPEELAALKREELSEWLETGKQL